MLIIFDKDGTLVETFDGKPANRLEEHQFLPGVLEKCQALRTEGHTLAVATNQGGVAFGFMTPEVAMEVVKHAAEAIGAEYYEVCFHHPKGRLKQWRGDCSCRKPAPGMLLTLMDVAGFAPENTLFVGDMEVDEQAAKAAGVRFEWAKDYFSWDVVG